MLLMMMMTRIMIRMCRMMWRSGSTREGWMMRYRKWRYGAGHFVKVKLGRGISMDRNHPHPMLLKMIMRMVHSVMLLRHHGMVVPSSSAIYMMSRWAATPPPVVTALVHRLMRVGAYSSIRIRMRMRVICTVLALGIVWGYS